MNENKMRELAKSDILERLFEVWEKLKPKREPLTKDEEKIVYYNLRIIELYIELRDGVERDEVNAIGFDITEEFAED